MLRILFAELNRTVSGPAIFIDRDGVINRKRVGDYVLDWSQFVFMPGMRMALSQLASLGLPLIVISNQAAVGKRLLDLEGLREITVQMHEALVAGGTCGSLLLHPPRRRKLHLQKAETRTAVQSGGRFQY